MVMAVVPTTNDRPPMNLNVIRGNEAAKRALEVAAAGHHPLHLIGPPGTGKSELRRVLEAIMNHFPASPPPTTEHWPCPCGYRGAMERECICTPKAIESHQDLIRRTLNRLPSGLWVETVRPSAGEMAKEGPLGEETYRVLVRVQAAWARVEEKGRPSEIDENAIHFLSAAYDRLLLSPAEWHGAVEVGSTIAVLSGSETIRAPHVAEAIQYRSCMTGRREP